MNHENFGLIMNPSQILLISTSPKTGPQDLAAFYAATVFVCPVGAR